MAVEMLSTARGHANGGDTMPLLNVVHLAGPILTCVAERRLRRVTAWTYNARRSSKYRRLANTSSLTLNRDAILPKTFSRTFPMSDLDGCSFLGDTRASDPMVAEFGLFGQSFSAISHSAV